MNLLATAFMALMIVGPPVDPPKPPPQPKSKVTPVTPKGGDLLVIDASAATGNVQFRHSFAPGSFIADGKRLLVAVPQSADTKTYPVTVVYFKEEAIEDVAVKVVGTDGPQPDDTVTLAQLAAKVDAGFASMDKRLKALEQKPPVPVDPFVQALQDAYVADGKPAGKLAALAAVYRQSGTVVNDVRFKKTKEVLDVMHTATQTALGEAGTNVTILPNVRQVLQAEFNRNIGGKTSTPLDDAARKLIAAEFSKAAVYLQQIQP